MYAPFSRPLLCSGKTGIAQAVPALPLFFPCLLHLPAHRVIEQLGVGATCDACRGVPQYRSPYYPNSQSFTRLQPRNLLTINAKRKPSSDFLFDLKAEEEGSGNYPISTHNKSLEVKQLGL